MTWLLAIDCSDQACSVALGGPEHTSQRYTEEPRQHAKLVLPMMRELLVEAEISKSHLNAIVVTVGPGSFTGLRIGLSVSQSLGYALGIPVIGVSSLLALSMGLNDVIRDASQIFVGIDARMGEVYCAEFSVDAAGQVNRNTEDLLLSQADAIEMAARSPGGAAIGSALKLPGYSELEFFLTDPQAQVRALDLLKIGLEEYLAGRTQDALALRPSYLRRENAWKTLNQQRSEIQ